VLVVVRSLVSSGRARAVFLAGMMHVEILELLDKRTNDFRARQRWLT